jgi:hypothetical protein
MEVDPYGGDLTFGAKGFLYAFSIFPTPAQWRKLTNHFKFGFDPIPIGKIANQAIPVQEIHNLKVVRRKRRGIADY